MFPNIDKFFIDKFLIDVKKKYRYTGGISKEVLLQASFDSARAFCETILGLNNLKGLEGATKRIPLPGFFPVNIEEINCFIIEPDETVPYCFLVANFENREGNMLSCAIAKISRSNKKKFLKPNFLEECESFYKKGILHAIEIALVRAELKGYKRARKKILDQKLC